MDASRQHIDSAPLKGASARTRKLMLQTAREMMQRGQSPSVSEVAEAAEVSRSTAYRYFPTRNAMVQAVVGEALGPILEWGSDAQDPVQRVDDLMRFSFPRILENEMTYRAALRASLEVDVSAGQGAEKLRGHRVELLNRALAEMPDGAARERLVSALSVLFGVEALVVLRDVCGLDKKATEDVVAWAAGALVRASGVE